MRKVFATLAAVSAIAIATPAMGATVVFSSGGSNATSSSRTFTGNDGTQVRVTAFSVNGSGQIVTGQLGQWSGGIGVQNSSGDDSHTTDNSGWKDFFLLSFSDTVRLGNATFTTNFEYNNGSCCLRDTDATIGSAVIDFPWASDLTGLAGQNQSVLGSFGLYSSNSTSTNSAQTRDINTADRVGNLWLVGASFTNTDNIADGFKFKTLTYDTAPPVPEPGTWALLILGFGGVGAAMRNRKRQAVVIA